MSTTEKKTINYKGQELECIDSGYWPDGVTLISTDYMTGFEVFYDVVCLDGCRAFSKKGVSCLWKYWAILLPKPAPLRLTNRELAGLCRKGYDLLWAGSVVSSYDYSKGNENKPCCGSVLGVRVPNSDEWLEPTSDLLEVTK